MTAFNLRYDGSDASASALSAWEQLLLSAGVSESGCASLVAGDTQKGNAIRSWVLANYARRYVPEQILEALGLGKQVLIRWPKEERQSAFSIATGEAHY